MTDVLDPYSDDLDWIDTQPDEAPPVPDDPAEADRLLRLLHRARDEADDIRDVFDHEIAVLTARRDDLLAAPQSRIDGLTRSLEVWALRQRGAGHKSVDLPHGRVATRAGRESVHVDDEPAVLEWATGSLEAIVEIPEPRPRVSKATVKTLLQSGVLAAVDQSGDESPLVIVATGEPVPGVTLHRSDPSVEIR